MDTYANNTNKSLLMYGCKGEVKQTLPKAESFLMSIVMFIMIAVSLFGNSLVISSICKYRRLRSSTNALLCSLAVSDLLSPLFRVIFIAVSGIAERWIFGCSWCMMSSQIGIFFCAASIAHLVAITLERYISIIHPYKRNKWLTRKKLGIIIVTIWAVSVILAVLPILFKSQIDLRFNSYILYCEVYLIKNPYLSIILLLVYFAIPFLIMIVAYYHIFRAADTQNRRMSTHSIGSRASKQKQFRKKEWKTVKTVLVVIGTFFILWVPIFIITIIKSYGFKLPYWAERLAICCAYLNACCNWIIYSVMNKELRKGFSKVLTIRITREGVKKGSRNNRFNTVTDSRNVSISEFHPDSNVNTEQSEGYYQDSISNCHQECTGGNEGIHQGKIPQWQFKCSFKAERNEGFIEDSMC